LYHAKEKTKPPKTNINVTLKAYEICSVAILCYLYDLAVDGRVVVPHVPVVLPLPHDGIHAGERAFTHQRINGEYPVRWQHRQQLSVKLYTNNKFPMHPFITIALRAIQIELSIARLKFK